MNRLANSQQLKANSQLARVEKKCTFAPSKIADVA